MTVEALAAWMLAIMLTSVPPGNSRSPKQARETAAQGRARYGQIAVALAKVVLDKDETPLFSGRRARLKTATLMLAMSRYESTWRRDVDLGIGPKARGGGGRYWCLMQIGVPKGKTPEGWTGRDLVRSRDRCFRRALHILQRGKRVCRKHGGTSFVNHYASGHCTRAKKPVKKRVDLMKRWLRDHAFPSPKRTRSTKKPSKKAPPKKGRPKKRPKRKAKRKKS